MENILPIWKETILEANSENDITFLEFIRATDNYRLFQNASDDDLKAFLHMTNGMLNEPNTRSKGMIILDKICSQISSSRLIIFQELVISSIHMIMKSIDSPLAHKLLARLFELCRDLRECNQVITAVIPKILSKICNNDPTLMQVTVEEINLLTFCLEKYHGPCGNFRNQLDKLLIPFVINYTPDKGKKNVWTKVLEAVPLLSQCGGGGGSRGDKHSNDWYQSVMRLCHIAYNTLISIYGDFCLSLHEQNPYQTEFDCSIIEPVIREEIVTVRTFRYKQRLLNLMQLISSYLRTPFNAAKPVPQRTILDLIIKSMQLNPVDIRKKLPDGRKPTREAINLSLLLPDIHKISYSLFRSLCTCVGTNLMSEAIRVEQLFAQEFKWLLEESSSFPNVKSCTYSSLLTWLNVTKGSVTSMKTLDSWITIILRDIQIEKSIVGLTKLNTGKGKKKKYVLPIDVSNTPVTKVAAYIEKESHITSLALQILSSLLPSVDNKLHRKIYETVAVTVAKIYETERFQSPYVIGSARSNLYELCLKFALHPHPSSPISLSLFCNLIRRGVSDTDILVVYTCQQALNILERVIHPVCPSMSLPINKSINIFLSENEKNEILQQSEINGTQMDVDDDNNEQEVEKLDNTCQTDVIEDFHASTTNALSVKSIISETIKEMLQNKGFTGKDRQENYSSEEDEDEPHSSSHSNNTNGPIIFNNGMPEQQQNKRKGSSFDEIINKKSKESSEEVNAEVQEMLNSFVDSYTK